MQTTKNNDSYVLIVDDNPKNLQVLGSTLRSHNLNVEFSTNGQAALDWIEKKEFDLILLDVMMPEMDGFEVCKRIREQDCYSDVPIIFLTAKTDRDSLLNGFKLGAQDFITKPFDSSELMARVKTHLDIKHSREELRNANQYLEEQVNIRTHQLAEINNELKSMDQVKGEFLMMLSHEIRNPLNGIIGPLQLLKARSENKDLINIINILDASVARLERFSYSAVLINKVKSGTLKIKKSSFNLRELFEFSMIKFNDIIRTKQIIVDTGEFPSDMEIETDSDLIHEVLLRIFDNAFNYTPEGTTVLVSARQTEDLTTLEVSDSGVGFPKIFLEKEIKLFNPGEEHVNKNIGMSLFLSQQIMNYLGGSLEIGNNEKSGAKVLISLRS